MTSNNQGNQSVVQGVYEKAKNLFSYIGEGIAKVMSMEDTRSLKDHFESKYGAVHPNFVEGAFVDAVDQSKREYKFMLIYIHSDMHQDTPPFCRDILCSEAIKEIVNEHYVFWGCQLTTKEGYELANQLQATTFPFLAIAAIVRNTIQVLHRLEGYQQHDTVVNLLIDVMENQQGMLLSAKLDDEEREQRRLEREAQDQAYQEALLRDQEKARLEQEKREEEERARREAEKARREEEERQMAIERARQELIRKRDIRRQNFPPEISGAQGDSSGQKIVLIKLRFPSGFQTQRKFLASDKIQLLHDFATIQDEANAPATDSFYLKTNFPKKTLNPELTFEQEQLYPQALVYIDQNE